MGIQLAAFNGMRNFKAWASETAWTAWEVLRNAIGIKANSEPGRDGREGAQHGDLRKQPQEPHEASVRAGPEPRSAGSADGRKSDSCPLDDMLEQSFPASDPPSHSGGRC